LHQRIPGDLYTEKNMLVLQKFQDIYLTNAETLNNSETVDKLSYLYNAWNKKVREKEKLIINAKEKTINVDIEHLEQSFKAEEAHGKFLFVPVTVVNSPSFESANEVSVPVKSEGCMNINVPEESQDFKPMEGQGKMNEPKRKRPRRTKEELKEDGFPCDFCPNHYSRKQNLKKHITDIHSKIAPITEGVQLSSISPCRMDGNGFPTDQNLFLGQDQGLQALEGLLQVNNQPLPQESSAAVSYSGSTHVADDISFNRSSIDFQDNSSFSPDHLPQGIFENQLFMPPVSTMAASSSSVLENTPT